MKPLSCPFCAATLNDDGNAGVYFRHPNTSDVRPCILGGQLVTQSVRDVEIWNRGAALEENPCLPAMPLWVSEQQDQWSRKGYVYVTSVTVTWQITNAAMVSGLEQDVDIPGSERVRAKSETHFINRSW